ncbi:tRNA pseudouridine(38-40) synthase TruA [Sphingomonas paeninsulae]|jgi:tRNA pseudouridine38-40 synthase|uniref:tRNA pseudouridine synthase A n=2 Tax=Sphingomonas paeninsulae TaxID=2319844 RepID=A0A494TEZ5_SPHPE|nr:tRNA pseudouridine(38-40) synthase TruA [Sphingomonas paeninsulae]
MGWQRQPHGATVQKALEDACAAILKETIVVHAAGRTDAGVHGLGMVAHLDVARVMTPFALMEAINAGLIDVPVAVIACETVAADFHARFACLARHYEYRIVNRRAPLTLGAGREWRIKKALDAEAMHDAAQILVGHHDFTTFRSVHCQSANPVKTLDRLDVTRTGNAITIRASARSFLHHQVRSMVGCLSLVGIGRWSAGDLREALEARDRTRLGLNAPPDGLYFVRADYP